MGEEAYNALHAQKMKEYLEKKKNRQIEVQSFIKLLIFEQI